MKVSKHMWIIEPTGGRSLGREMETMISSPPSSPFVSFGHASIGRELVDGTRTGGLSSHPVDEVPALSAFLK